MHYSLPISSSSCAYKRPWTSSTFALSFPSEIAARPAQFLAGSPLCRHSDPSISAQIW
jgi:hypothetical protein